MPVSSTHHSILSFAKDNPHPSVPLMLWSAIARSSGQGRDSGVALPLTGASPVACSPKRRKGIPALLIVLLTGCLYAAMPLTVPVTGNERRNHAAAIDRHAPHIAHAARRFGIPARWIRAVMRVESGGRIRARSHAGAMGLMQIMPATWGVLRVRYALGRDPYDPRDNILAGTAYLREMHDRFGSPGFLAAYNAGPGRYEQHLAGRPLPAETRAYVAKLAPLIAGGKVVEDAPRKQPFDDSRVAEEAQPDRAPVAAMPRDLTGLVPQSGGLFVTRSSVNRPF